MLGWGFPSGQTVTKETDGPYMCPEPFRGQTAHPGHVHRVAETWFLSLFVVTDFLSILSYSQFVTRPKKMGKWSNMFIVFSFFSSFP